MYISLSLYIYIYIDDVYIYIYTDIHTNRHKLTTNQQSRQTNTPRSSTSQPA